MTILEDSSVESLVAFAGFPLSLAVGMHAVANNEQKYLTLGGQTAKKADALRRKYLSDQPVNVHDKEKFVVAVLELSLRIAKKEEAIE